MQNSKKPDRLERDSSLYKTKAVDYITAGVGCNCLVTLSETGILNTLIDKGYVSLDELEVFGEPICLTSALITLEKSEVVKKEGDRYCITEFGLALAEQIGLITVFFDGYGSLVAQQGRIAKSGMENRTALIHGAGVSKASTQISEKMIDPIIIREILEVNLSGTICDLGCGYAKMLFKICKETGNPGLGFDSEPNVVEQAKERFKNTSITVEVGDLSKLEGIWEDVVILMQCHVFHDFTPNQNCIDIMNSYLHSFPNLKCFFYMDTVAPSLDHDELFPGFDYVHGLLGIPTRTYEETMQMFSDSKYKLIKEVSLELPNTFLWVLSPKEAKEREDG